MPTYNLISIDTVTFETALARYEKDFGSEVFLKTATEGDDPGYRVITEEKPTNRFASMEQFEVYTDYVNMLYEMRELEFDIHENNLPMIGILPFVLSDLMLLDHNGTMVIGDTLFVIDSVKTVLKSLDGEVIGEKPHDAYTSRETKKSQGEISSILADESDSKRSNAIIWYDKTGTLWEIRVFMQNVSAGYGIRRSIGRTIFEFKAPFGSWGNSDDYNNLDLVSLFPNFEAHVKIYTRFKKGFKGCANRTRSDSGVFRAEVVKGRCKNTGVTSDHWALMEGFSYGMGTEEDPIWVH